MRRNWFRNRLGRKNSRAHRQRHFWNPRLAPRWFSGSLERLEDRRLLSAASVTNGVLNITGDLNQNDFFNLIVDAGDNTKLDVAITNNSGTSSFGPFTIANISQINVSAVGNGSNTLTVDSGNGLISPPIQYVGGAGGLNYLDLIQTANTTVRPSESYNIGQNPGEGAVSIVGAVTETVLFQNVTKTIDEVPVTSALLQATNGNDAINFTNASFTGPTATGYGISVNNQPIWFFYNKINVTVDAGAGDDTINVNAPSPSTTTDLLNSITVEGNDPTASDTLIVNGTSGTDSINYEPSTTTGDGAVTVGTQPTINFNGIEQLDINGQGGNDSLTYTSPANGGVGSLLTFTPGATVDAGTIVGRQFGGTSYTPLDFSNVGVDGTLIFATANSGPSDALEYNGTVNSDIFNVNGANGGTIQITKLPGGSANYNVTLSTQTPGVNELFLQGVAGDDIFNINDSSNGSLPYTFGTFVEGGPSSDPTLNYTSPANAATTVNLAAGTISAAGANPISFTGVTTINLNVNGGALTVVGSGSDSIGYTPTGSQAGTVSEGGTGPVINFTHESSTFTLDPGTGTNSVTVNGTAGSDTIQVQNGATITGDTQVTVIGFPQVQIVNADTANLIINGGTGNDELDVFSISVPVTIPITYDGGPGTNALFLSSAGPSGVAAMSDVYTPGSQPGSGTDVLTFASGTESVSFQNLAPVFDLVPGTLTVNGTNASNAINYSEGFDNLTDYLSNTPSASFGQVSVDSYEPIDFTNKSSLTINALAGDDAINLDDPTTPTGMSLSTGITVNGDDPTASDTLTVNGIPGTNDHFVVVPTAAGNGQVFDDDSTGAALAPTVSFSGIEKMNVVGQAVDADSLAEGTPGEDNLTVDPGSDAFSGTITGYQFSGFNFVPISYSGIGGYIAPGAGLVNPTNNQSVSAAVGGDDTVIIDGTSGDDTFSTDASFNSSLLGIHVSNSTASYTVVLLDAHASNHEGILRGLDGNDTFNLGAWHTAAPTATLSLRVEGGDSDSSSDTINYTSNSNAAVTIDYGLGKISSSAAGDVPVTYTGVEKIIETSSSASSTLLVNGTANPDNIVYTPTSTSGGIVTETGEPTINFSGVGSTFTIDPVGASNTVTVNGTQNADSFNVTKSGSNTIVTLSGALAATLVSADTPTLFINGLDGTDNLTVDTSNGPIFPTINFDGGAGLDTALMTGSGDASTYTPGPLPGAGTDTLFVNGLGTTILNFVNTELLNDDATTLLPFEIVATGASDAINYSAGGPFGNHASSGLVSVNNLTPVQFVNKTTLQIDAGAGDDTINLNNASTPANLTGITVNGDDPTASDTLIVNGTSGNDTINYKPSATIGSGTVQVNALPLVTFNTIEGLIIDGQGGIDALTVTTPAGGNFDTYTPGAAPDSGTIAIRGVGAGTALVPLTFQHIGAFGKVTFATTGGTRGDNLELDGTNNSDDFSLNATTAQIINPAVGGFVTDTLFTPGIAEVQLRGLEGDDQFSITGPLPYAGGVFVDGGDPSSSDTVILSGATGAVSVTLGDPSIGSNTQITTGYGNSITLIGVEVANLDAGGNSVSFAGTSNADSIAVTPTGSNSASVQDYTGGTAQNGQGGTLATMTPTGPLFNFTSVSTAVGGFAVNGNGGSDQLFVEATQGADTIDVNDATSGSGVVKVNPLLSVGYNSAMPHVEIDALAGSDIINIAPSTVTTFLVDGGDPIDVLPGDTINLIHPAGFYQLFPGPTSDSGGLNSSGYQTISWAHIETVTNTGGTPIITGTNGDDQITIIARDNTYNPANPGTPNPLLDGHQDFTVSINDGPNMLFIDTPDLLVDSEAGNDDIDVQEPASHATGTLGTQWDVQVYVAGGTPSAGIGGLGDTVELETPAQSTLTTPPAGSTGQNVTYAPDVAAPALAGVTFGPNSQIDTAQFNDTTNAATITAVSSFQIAGFYQSSPGGVEQFVYQADNGVENLTYLTPNLSSLGLFGSAINYTPGATASAGTITTVTGTALVPLSFQGLNEFGSTITFSTSNAGRSDSLNVNGTASNDTFSVSGTGGAGAGEVQVIGDTTVSTLGLITPSISILALSGNGGTDTFNISGGLPYGETFVNGSDPTVNLSDATGPVSVALGNNAISSSITTITGYGGRIMLIGIDTANLDANNASRVAQTVFVGGTAQPESFVYTPTGAGAATLTDSGISTVFNFTDVSTAAGGFTLDPAGGSDTVAVNGTSSNDGIVAASGTGVTTVQVNSLLALTLPTSPTPPTTEALVIEGGTGNDDLQVNSTNGAELIPITYDGGAGTNSLSLTGGTATADTYTPGSQLGSGTDALTFASGSELVNFLNLAPIFDSVAGPLTVYGTNAANAINYSVGYPNLGNYLGNMPSAAWGQVSVDSYEPIEFTNKTTLAINALAGSDEINLNNPSTPGPTGLTGITVNGNDPTASDTLIVNGTSGTDAINYKPDGSTIGSGTVQVNALPLVTFNTIEQLKIDGQGGADNLTLTTPPASDNVTYTPGATPDAGSISINGINGLARVPLSFTHIGGSVTFANGPGGREDNVNILGTSNSDDFSVNGPADTVQIFDTTSFNAITEVLHTNGAAILQLSGQSGDDVFNVTGPMQYSLILDGGDPSASDTANISGATGLVTVSMANPAAITFGPTSFTTITGYSSAMNNISLTGVEIANLNTNTFGLTVDGNSSPNSFTYTPTAASAGTFSESGINTVFNFTNTLGTFTINGSVGSTADQVTLEGTASRDLISIDQGARTATLTNVANVAYKTVTLGSNIQVLTAQGLSGQDTFLVTPAPGTQFPQSLVNPVGNTNNLLIDVDGGAGGSGENNALVIATQTGGMLSNSDFVVVNRGADGTSGTVRTYGPPATGGAQNIQFPDINYINIQTVSPDVGTDQNAGAFHGQPNLLILGPDLNEPNQNPLQVPVPGTTFNATVLGSGSTINVQNAAIFPNSQEFPFVPADQDYYRLVAQNTGTLDFQVYFNLYDSTLFPQGGTLNIQVLDVNGNVIASGTPASFGSVGSTANARIRIPVVAGQTYFLHVFGANAADGSPNSLVVNGYNMTIINTPAPTPGTIELSESVPNGEPNAPLTTQGTPDTGQLPANAPPSDSGRSQFDNVTNGGFDNTTDAANAAAAGTSGTLPAPTGATLGKPTIYITLDDSFLLNDIPGNQTPGGVPGTSAIPINFNSSTTLVPTFSNAPINGVAFNGNYRIAVYDGGNGAMSATPGSAVNNPIGHDLPGGGGDSTFIGFAEPVPATDASGNIIPGQFVPHLYMLTVGSQGGGNNTGIGPLGSDTLDDGVHNITAQVQIIEPKTSTNPIKTAFGARSQSLQITIDTVAPPVQFGFDANQHGAITPGSDSGVVTEPETSTDLVTNVTAPTFQGLAEANSIVYLYAAITNPTNPNYSPNPVFPQNFVSIGKTVAIPLDGTNAYPNGQWTLTSTLDLNDPLYFTRDGLRTIVVQAEDLAGNKSPDMPFNPLDILQIEIDTQGPQVTDVVISDPTIAPSGTNGENLNYNLFSEKFGTNSAQAQQGPTPLVYAITINLQDLPVRTAQFLSELAFKPEVVEGQEIDDSGEFADGGLSLIGDANGRIAFTVVANPLDSPPDPSLPNTTPGAATGEVQLRFKDANGNPIALPDDRYTLTINDTAIVDPAGNKLDGESDAAEPLNNPNFPSGNGVPGGNFVARFTVDSRPELGDFAAAQVYIDANGNFIYDPQNADFTNRDLTFTMQVDPNLAGIAQLGVHDSVFVGKFAAAGATPPPTGYFSKLGAYGVDPLTNSLRWLIDTDGDGLADMYVPQPTGFSLTDQNGQSVTFAGSGIAIAGEFDGNTADGDEIGLFDGSHFWLDTNHDFQIDAGDTVITTQLRGFPIVGDFNGDGTVDLGTWQTDVFQFNFGIGGTGGNSGIPAQFTGNKDATINWGFPGVGEIPLAADMDGDGITDIGLWVPGRAGTVPQDTAEEYFLLSNDFNAVTGLPNNTGLSDPNAAFQLLNHPFNTFPLGHDLYANLLDEYATPIVGNFDPPLAPSAAAASSVDPTVLAGDVTPPTSTVTALPATQTTTSFTVSWGGSDNSGGSGIASYDIWVSDNGGHFTKWISDTTNTSATFNGVNGHTYGFMSVATDNSGNVQATPAGAQATTKVQLLTSIATTTTLKSSIASITTGQSVTFTATVSAATGGGTPTGSVTFKDGSTTLTTITLSGGVATYTNTTFTAASHSITAMYNPIAPDVGSVSTALIETVTNAAAPPPAGMVFNGTSGNDIFTISPANATGSVTVSISNTSTKNKATVLGTFVPTGTIIINGLAGNDTLQISTATIGGKVVTLTAPVYFSGGDGTDTLIGANVANVWNITGANSGTLNNVTFDTVENLTGGASTDAFRFSAGGSVSGKITGAAGANTLDYSAYGIPATVSLAANSATGTGGIANITSIVGSPGSTLVGMNSNTAWSITGAGSGTAGTVSFSGMANLTGGSGADTFTLANNAGVAGLINGGGGTDTLKYSYTSAVTVNLAAGTATGTGGIANFEVFAGGTSTSDTLVGPNTANTWTVSTANSGKLNTLTFSGFENLTGGSLNDNFVFGKSIGVSGHIDGGAGLNMLDYNAYTTAINVNLATGTATNIGGGVSNFSVVRGGSGNDTIQADNGNDVLIGGAGNDTLTAGAGRDILFGGLGADTLIGGSGEDILISGTTKFDSNLTTIDSLLAYWSNSSLDYATRVAALRAGSVAGVPALTAANIVNDTSADKLTGGSGLDWFFASLSGTSQDTVTNLTSGEQEN